MRESDQCTDAVCSAGARGAGCGGTRRHSPGGWPGAHGRGAHAIGEAQTECWR